MDPAAIHFLLTQVPTATLALIGLYLFVTGKLHSDAELRQARADLETERDAHEQTRIALALANERAATGAQAAGLIVSALEGARHAQIPPP